SQPIYRLIMTAAERAELAAIGSNQGGAAQSNAQMNGTLIKEDGTGLSVRYNVGIRNRGHGSAVGPPNNYHINIPHDVPVDNATSVILNVRGPETQVLGHAVVRMAGMPAGDASFAQVRVNGQSAGSLYAFVELPDGEYVDKHLS